MDRHDTKVFYDGLKVYGTRDSGSVPVRSKDGGTLINDRAGVMNRWALNQSSQFDSSVLDEIPQWDTEHSLMDPIPDGSTESHLSDVVWKITRSRRFTTGAIPSRRRPTNCQADQRFHNIWQQRAVPQDFKDALMVHIFKRKGDRHTCDDHRGIALLSIPGKILARVIASRLTSYVEAHGVLPESQCGFRAGRSTTDMTFTVRQIQEKCKEQRCVRRPVEGLRLRTPTGTLGRLRKIGCPPAFVNIIRSLHDGMMAAVVENGECSPEFKVTNGTKQGCVLAPLLFLVFFSMMLRVAFNDRDRGIHVHSERRRPVRHSPTPGEDKGQHCAGQRPAVCGRLRSRGTYTGWHPGAVRPFLHFGQAVWALVSIKKTEALHQPYPPNHPGNATVIAAGDSHLKSVSKFCYLGSYVTSTISQDEDITARIAKASSAFGKLRQRL